MLPQLLRGLVSASVRGVEPRVVVRPQFPSQILYNSIKAVLARDEPEVIEGIHTFEPLMKAVTWLVGRIKPDLAKEGADDGVAEDDQTSVAIWEYGVVEA